MGVRSKSAFSGCGTQYSQAFSASVADVEGLQLAALDTLQHGLARDAKGAHRVEDGRVAGWRVVDEQGAELVIDADRPGSAGGVLLAGDESGLQPAVDGGGGGAEFVGGLADGQQLAVGRFGRWLVCRDLAVPAEAGDDDLGEALAAGGAAALAVENPGDGGVVVVGGEAGEQRDRVLVGADRGLVSWQRDDQLGDRAAPPADRDGRAVLLALDVEDDFFDQAAQELLAVAVGGCGRGPHAAEVCAEREQLLAFGVGQRPRSLLLAQRELGFGVGERVQRLFPVALQAARDQAVLGLDVAVAALSALGLVSRLLDLEAPLRERGVVILLEGLGRVQRCFHARGCERGEQRTADRVIDLGAADPQAPASAAVDEDAGGAVVGGALVPAAALIVDFEFASAAAADGDPLQQREAFADRAAGFVRARARVASDPLAVSLERRLVDVAGVVIPDQHAPLCLGQTTHSLAGVAVLVDVALAAGLAERVRARVYGALEDAVDLVVGRDRPLDLAAAGVPARRELQLFAAHPQPYLADRSELSEPVKDRGIAPRIASSPSSRISPSSSPHTSPTGSALRSSPRSALLRIPPCSRARRMCSSASLIVPFSPNSNRSLNDPG